MHASGQGYMEISIPSSRFCCGAKTALEKKS